MKKDRVIFKLLDGGIFGFDFLFTVGSSEKEIIKYIKNKLDYELDEEEIKHIDIDGKSGRTVRFKNGATLIWVKHDYIPIIAHEINHAVEFTLNTVGILLNDDTSEVYTYFAEHLWRQLCQDKNARAYLFK